MTRSLAITFPILSSGFPFSLNDETYLRWPLPPAAQKYGAIEGLRLKPYVRDLAAISAESRNEGNQWWGRITGPPSHAETQQWTADQFRRINH